MTIDNCADCEELGRRIADLTGQLHDAERELAAAQDALRQEREARERAEEESDVIRDRALEMMDDLRRERDQARAEAERLREFAWHKVTCTLYNPVRPSFVSEPEPKCTCGLDAALAAAAPGETVREMGGPTHRMTACRAEYRDRDGVTQIAPCYCGLEAHQPATERAGEEEGDGE